MVNFLSAADQRHDFQPVAIAQDVSRVLRARHDFEIQLHRHVRLRDAQLAEQVGHGAAVGDFARSVR